MNKFLAAIAALRYGSSLADSATYKNRQNLLNALIGLLGAVMIFLPMEVSANDVANIAGGIAAVVGLFNIYTTTATTDKIGVRAASEADAPGLRSPEEQLPQDPDDGLPFRHLG